MPNQITVRRNLVVESLLDINDPAFAHWYELGVYWAMYGDGQGSGCYDDCYLITNLTSHIRSGWYDDCNSGWFPMLGFELGMVHGGYLVEPSDSLGILTDPDFANVY